MQNSFPKYRYETEIDMINFTLICDPTISRSNQNKLLFLDTFECLKSLLFCRYGNYIKNHGYWAWYAY